VKFLAISRNFISKNDLVQVGQTIAIIEEGSSATNCNSGSTKYNSSYFKYN
jgi:hypothetical protein